MTSVPYRKLLNSAIFLGLRESLVSCAVRHFTRLVETLLSSGLAVDKDNTQSACVNKKILLLAPLNLAVS